MMVKKAYMDEQYKRAYSRWKRWGHAEREQAIARTIFGLDVNKETGMIATPKPSGGVRLEKLPAFTRYDVAYNDVQKMLETKGWKFNFEGFGSRSTLTHLTITNEETGDLIDVNIMPLRCAIYFGSILALASQGGHPDNGLV